MRYLKYSEYQYKCDLCGHTFEMNEVLYRLRFKKDFFEKLGIKIESGTPSKIN